MRNFIFLSVLVAVYATPSSTGGPSSPEVCLLPKDLGSSDPPCTEAFPLFAFIKEKNRCEMFSFNGCAGNANKFQSAEDCYKTCGGDTPSTSKHCDHVKCDLRLSHYYEDRGCRPQYQPGACCPIRYVCPDGEVASGPSCSYRGVRYAVGERIPQITEDIPCKAGCYCHGEGNRTEIVCANVECFHPDQFNPNCTRVYDHRSCCPTKYICPGDKKAAKSRLRGRYRGQNVKFFKGERIPSDDPCKTCLWLEGFYIHGAAVCKDVHCIIDPPAPDCVPVYAKDYCCPVDYTCPKRVIEPEREAETIPVATLPAAVGESFMNHTPPTDSPVIKPVQEPATVPVTTIPAAVDQTPGSGAANLSALTPGESEEIQAEDRRCLLPKDVGPCRGFKPSFYYDTEQQQCLLFNYGGCKGNGNRFETLEECQKACNVPAGKSKYEVCNQPKEGGNCRASKNSFYYDTESKRCKTFLYGGCGGNENNFRNREGCEKACELIFDLSLPITAGQNEQSTATSRELGEVCNLSPDAGPCRSYEKRYFFNATAEECQQFSYGGCRGNENNFLTLDECSESCVNASTKEVVDTSRARTGAKSSSPNPDCKLSADSGFCRANVTRFYYDDADKSCKPFNFGGCYGNGNNFMTETECLAACSPEQPSATDSVLAEFNGATRDLPVFKVVPAPDECAFGNLTLKIGDSVETGDPCVNCTCHTPPVVSCTRQTCLPSPYVPVDPCADHVCPQGTVCTVQRNELGSHANCVAEVARSPAAVAAKDNV